jgi:hypothetical protein
MKFYHESVGECISQVYKIEANSWEEAKKAAFDNMKEGDILAECSPNAVKKNETYPEYCYIDENLCENYATLQKGTWANTPSGREYWEDCVWYFSDKPETFLNGKGEEFTNWEQDEK